MTEQTREIDNVQAFTREERIEAALRLARVNRAGVLTPRIYRPDRSDAEIGLCPRWPSGIAKLDAMTGGGVYGVTTIAGAPKVGKSHLAVAVAWHAARAGACVVYLSADQAIDQTLRALGRYVAAQPLFDDGCRDWIHVLDVVVPMSSDTLAAEIGNCLGAEERPLVLVIDSLNSFAQLLGGDYFTKLHDVLYFLVRARRLAQGDVTAVAVAELNKGGDVKGRQAIYASDVIVRLQKAKAGGAVEIDVQFSRESASGLVGNYLLDHESARFYPVAQEAPEWTTR